MVRRGHGSAPETRVTDQVKAGARSDLSPGRRIRGRPPVDQLPIIPLLFGRGNRQPWGGLVVRVTLPVALIPLAIAAAIVVAGGCSLLGARPSDAVRIAPGECFDQPSNATDTSNVQRQLCSLPHDAEAISSTTHPAEPGATYPTAAELRTFMRSACVPAFATYTGVELRRRVGPGLRALLPGPGEVERGRARRRLLCLLHGSDEADGLAQARRRQHYAKPLGATLMVASP